MTAMLDTLAAPASHELDIKHSRFLAKAAPEIVEKDRTKAAELGGTVAKLTSQLADLSE